MASPLSASAAFSIGGSISDRRIGEGCVRGCCASRDGAVSGAAVGRPRLTISLMSAFGMNGSAIWSLYVSPAIGAFTTNTGDFRFSS